MVAGLLQLKPCMLRMVWKGGELEICKIINYLSKNAFF